MSVEGMVLPARQSGERVWLWVGLLLATYLVVTPWGIQNQSVSNPDEPLYASAAREMIRGGDKIVPVFNTKPRLVKPIMIYWVLIAGAEVGTALGLPLLTALHLGPLFMGLLAALGTFLIGRRFRDARFGFMAALVLITAHRFHSLSRALLVDMTLTAFLVWAWFCFLVAVERLEHRAGAVGALLGCYLCLGAACMTKGPVLVAVFAVGPMLAFLFWTGRGQILKQAGLWWGAPLALVVGLWWFAVLAQRGYAEDVYRFFTTQNFERFVEAEGADGHPWPYVFYIVSLGEAFLPWSFALPVALWFSWRAWRTVPSSGWSWQARLVICAVVLPFAAMGLSINKRALYLLPLYPFLALYVVWTAECAFFSRREEGTVRKPDGWRYRTAFAILAAAGMLTLGTELFVRPARERFYARADFYQRLDELSAGRPVTIAGLDINEAVWYLDRPKEAIEACGQAQLAAGFMPTPDRALVVREDFLALHGDVQAKFTVLGGNLRTRDATYAVVIAK